MLQSVLFDKKKWTKKGSKAWLRRHDLKTDLDDKGEYYHYRQKNPKKGDKYYTLDIGDGIKYVIEKK